MMGAKAARNRKADDEVEYLAAAMRGESASSVDDRALLASSKRVADEMKAQLAKARAEAAEAQHRAREAERKLAAERRAAMAQEREGDKY